MHHTSVEVLVKQCWGPAQVPAYAGFRQLPTLSHEFFYHRHLSDSIWVVHQASIHVPVDTQPVGSSITPKRSGKKLQECSPEISTMQQRSAGEVIFNISFNQLCIKGWNHSPIFLSSQFLAKIDGSLQPCNKLQGVSPS